MTRDTDPLFLTQYVPDNRAAVKAVLNIGGAATQLTPPVMGNAGTNHVGDQQYPRFVMFQADAEIVVEFGVGGQTAASVTNPNNGSLRDAANSGKWYQIDGSGAGIKVSGHGAGANIAVIWGN